MLRFKDVRGDRSNTRDSSRRADRQEKADFEAGAVIFQRNSSSVKASDRSDEAQPQAGAGLGAAFIQADKSFEGALPILGGDSGAVIGDGNFHIGLARLHFYAD